MLCCCAALLLPTHNPSTCLPAVPLKQTNNQTGDAILNVRKAKLIASYELAIRISWSGTTPDGAPGSGLIELPYVADENHDEDPEVK